MEKKSKCLYCGKVFEKKEKTVHVTEGHHTCMQCWVMYKCDLKEMSKFEHYLCPRKKITRGRGRPKKSS